VDVHRLPMLAPLTMSTPPSREPGGEPAPGDARPIEPNVEPEGT
jgi:hypothetical protein